ncbi:hypothetical protein NDU88_004387 [Pleurodeles waltl]|uniref:Uncharacterized protein n=1 Tax=Pleurodeles waltl TaxID=8319 RepID=A0AAV7WWE9_PLEWA|nr:hypothetical protein NDU88_004387 [Pleurodeles waltl]
MTERRVRGSGGVKAGLAHDSAEHRASRFPHTTAIIRHNGARRRGVGTDGKPLEDSDHKMAAWGPSGA